MVKDPNSKQNDLDLILAPRFTITEALWSWRRASLNLGCLICAMEITIGNNNSRIVIRDYCKTINSKTPLHVWHRENAQER